MFLQKEHEELILQFLKLEQQFHYDSDLELGYTREMRHI